ncbi:hypothetical protein COMA1_20652 [Candidatus Nitrospira nitrosa]|uniref:Uncharacterized protein n=1 Tax=Candidatus Nitrospira nitrosa TaxID=1742972 RepID=A0A0S4LHS4_9BACT|nr:hypothetical protein COMA1_20652 [Candidatus Nitrospira nitrosa]
MHLVEDKSRHRTTARLTQIIWGLYVHVSPVVCKKARPELSSPHCARRLSKQFGCPANRHDIG